MKHIEGNFKGRKGLSLYYQGWIPEQNIKAVMIIAHGIAEHSGRYLKLASHFASSGFAVYSFDYRGHGHSQGRRGYVEDFSYFIDDFRTFHSLVVQTQPGKKLFVLGHSMGAAISLIHAASCRLNLNGIILSATPLKPKPYFPLLLVGMLRLLAAVMPGLPLYRLNSATLSRDNSVVVAYNIDPLVYHDRLTCRLALGLVWRLGHLVKSVSQIRVPALIMHGTDDKLCSPEGSQIVYDRIRSEDKTLKFYNGFYHEILNDPEGSRVIADMETWLYRQINKPVVLV